MSEVQQQVQGDYSEPGKPVSLDIGKIQKVEDNVEELRKIFVGGLNRDTTDDDFKNYFSKYGEVVDSVIIRDNQKLSKGFGFVTFGTIEATDACIREKITEVGHELSGKKIDIKRAMPKEFENSQHGIRDKLFLGGIKDGITEEILGMYFEEVFGIKEKSISLKKDNDGKLKGFGFLTVEADTDMLKNDIVDKIAIIQRHTLNGTQFDTKKAVPKNEAYSRGGGGYGGGRGGHYNNYGNNYGYYDNSYGASYGYQNTWNAGGGAGGRGGRGAGGNRYQPY